MLKTKTLGCKDWLWWRDYLGSRSLKRINHNTFIKKAFYKNNLEIVLHRSTIITISPLNRYQLNTGNWRTVTTKRRLNELSPLYIYQHNYDWYWEGGEFKEGIIVDIHKNIYNSLN